MTQKKIPEGAYPPDMPPTTPPPNPSLAPHKFGPSALVASETVIIFPRFAPAGEPKTKGYSKTL